MLLTGPGHELVMTRPCFALLLRFDIVLMKEGRMKGQAFVGLPNEQSAEKALRETNGFVLYDKPLVVVSFFFPPTLAGTNEGKSVNKSRLRL